MSAKGQFASSFYKKVIECLHDAVVAIDSHGVILTWNRASESLLGYTANEVIGLHLSLMIPEMGCTKAEESSSLQSVERVKSVEPFASLEPVESVETIARTKGGHDIPVELNFTTFELEDDERNEGLNLNPVRVVVLRNIAEQNEQKRRLTQSERWLQTVSDSSLDIITYTVMGHGIVYVSPSIESLLGYAPADIVGGKTKLSYHPDDEVELDRFENAILSGVESYRFTARLKHRDGRYIWFETTFKVMRDKTTQRIEVLGIGRDISERKAIQSRFEHAQRIAKLGHWERRFRDNSFYWSDEVYHICGLNPSEPMVYEQLDSIIHPQDRPRLRQAFKDAERGAPYDMEYRIVRPNGEIRFIHSQGEHVYDGNHIVGMFGSLQDITDRKQVEEALRRSKEGLKFAHRIAGLGHWDIDLRNGEAFYSDELLHMLGIMPEGLPLDFDILLRVVHPDDIEQIDRMRTAFAEKTTFDLEFRVIRSDESVRTMRSVSHIIVDGDGTPSRLFGIVQDTTEQKKTEEMLKRSEMLSVVGQLAAGLAHEIRNPLTSIKGFTQILATSNENPYLGIMKSELQRIESIVNELLALAKPQAVIYKPASIKSILQDVIDLLDPQAIMHDVRLTASFCNEDLFVECDSNQLKQVFINIIKNAIEAVTSGGGLRIQLHSSARFAVLDFEDDGVGIPEDVLRSLGQPFVSTKPQGVGLGFMISQKIVQDHGGKIHVESTVGVGTRVSVCLPLLKG